MIYRVWPGWAVLSYGSRAEMRVRGLRRPGFAPAAPRPLGIGRFRDYAMPKNGLVPELMVSSLDRSLRFYRDLAGFRVEYARPENGFVYLSFFGSELMLEEDRDEESPWIVEPRDYPRGRGLNLSIDCPDARELAARLEQNGICLRKPVEECWYRAERILHGQLNFLVMDPDGYLLRFSESLGTRPAGGGAGGS